MMQNGEEETQGSKSCQETEGVTATGLIFNPEAEPPYLQMETILNLNSRFRLTWEMKRADLEDSSPSGYDMELANFGVAAGLRDQVIVDLIIAFRSRHNLTKELRVDYYLRTLKMEEEMEEEMEAISDLDPTSPKMALGYSHRTYRTVELRKFTASRQECVCGAHRETGLMLSGTWEEENRWIHPGREPIWKR